MNNNNNGNSNKDIMARGPVAHCCCFCCLCCCCCWCCCCLLLLWAESEVQCPLWFIWDAVALSLSPTYPSWPDVVINASVAGFLIIPVTKPPFKFAMNAKQPNS